MEVTVDPLTTLPGIGPDVRDNMMALNINSVDDVRECSEKELRQVPGVGKSKAEFLTEYLE